MRMHHGRLSKEDIVAGSEEKPPTLPEDSQVLGSLGELYQEVIQDHVRRPRFRGKGDPCLFCEEGKNPLCGDQIRLYCKAEPSSPTNAAHGPLISISFEGSGCSISQASASILCSQCQKVTVDQALAFIQEAEQYFTGQKVPALGEEDDLESDVEALSGVRRFPVRIKCAALAWKTLEMALKDRFIEKKQHLSPKPRNKKLNIVQ